jgi:hypothetical protein
MFHSLIKNIVSMNRLYIIFLFVLLPIISFSQRNPSAIYGTWLGEVYENEQLTGKMVMITQEAPGNEKVRFTVNFLDLNGKEIGTPVSVVGDYFYYAQEQFKHTATIDWNISGKNGKPKKLKGGMYFGLAESNGTTYFNGTFMQSNKSDETYGAVRWKLTRLAMEDAITQSNNSSARVIDYGAINDFHEGFAVVRKGERYGMIDARGNEFIPLGKYSFTMEKEAYGSTKDKCGFYNGMSVVKDVETEKYGYIDTTGKLIIPATLRNAYPFTTDGYGYGEFMDWGKNIHLNYFFDKKGRRYAAKVNTIGENPFVVSQSPDGRTTIFTRKNGTKAFETKLRVNNYSEGFYSVTQFSDNNVVKHGYIDTTGKLVIPFKFNGRTHDFHNGLALYEPNFQDEYIYSFINKKGEEVIVVNNDSGIDRVFEFENGYAGITLKSRQIALTDSLGKMIIPEDIFRQANPELFKDLSTIWGNSFSFTYKSRNSYGIIFSVSMALKPNSASEKLYVNKKERTTGGVGGGQKDYIVKGTGMMDYNGRILILPQLEAIGEFDKRSGLAKATFYNQQTNNSTQGFINSKGEFVLILKNTLQKF